MDEKPKRDWNKSEIGALWKKTKSDQAFYSGKVKIGGKDHEIICFTNKHKTTDAHPDVRVYLSEEPEKLDAII